MLPLAIAALGLGSSAQARSFEDVVSHARAHSPTAELAADDLVIADSSYAQSIGRVTPAVSMSDRHTLRHNNPDAYSFDLGTSDCEQDPSRPCIPFSVIDGQVVEASDTWSNSLSLSVSQPLSVSPFLSVLQNKRMQRLTRLTVQGDDEALVQQLVQQYGNLQFDVGALEIYEASLALALETEAATEGSHAAGESTDLDLDLARHDVAEARLKVAQTERLLPLDLEALVQVAGLDRDTALRVCPFAEDPDDGAAALETTGATELAILEQQVELDRLSRTGERLGLLPGLTLMGGGSWSGSGTDLAEVGESFRFNNWYVGGTLSLSLLEGLGRHFANRSASASLRQSRLSLATQQADLELSDRELALELVSLSEDRALLVRSVELSERNVVATRSLWLEGGESFDRYTMARSSLEQTQLQLLSVQQQQQSTMAMRKIQAGHTAALLDHLFTGDGAHAASDRCRELSP